MNRATAVDVYDSQTSRYHQAFQVFLNHTDQKDTARYWLNGHVGRLPQRRVLIDAGAEYNYYTGDITRTFPVNGKFSPAQKACYQAVLDIQKQLAASSRSNSRREA